MRLLLDLFVRIRVILVGDEILIALFTPVFVFGAAALFVVVEASLDGRLQRILAGISSVAVGWRTHELASLLSNRGVRVAAAFLEDAADVLVHQGRRVHLSVQLQFDLQLVY